MPSFVAHVYEDDYRQIRELVQHYPHIETGGDLFGLWKDERTVIIQQFIGPGKECKRTSTSFHQDIEYLHKVGSLITTEEGLCNVGEWHSHHQIGMPEPSEADRRTVFSNMPHLGLERFVLFIASIEVNDSSGKRPHDVQLDHIKLRPFLFLGSKRKVVEGEIKKIPHLNPHRLHSRAGIEIENGKEPPPPPKYIEEGSGPRKQGKNKNETPIRTEAELPALSSSDDESVGGKPRDDQQRRGREPDKKRGGNREERGNQTQMKDGYNNENRSPNTAPIDRGSQSLPAHSTFQMNTQTRNPQTTSAPNSLSQVWVASSQLGTAQQGHGRGNTQPMNTQPTGGAYSSDQNPQRPRQYTQQKSQRSARDRDNGQAKDRSGTITVGKIGAGGYF